MRLTSQTHLAFLVLMATSLTLGACAAHKRISVDAIRADRDSKMQQAAEYKANGMTPTDWATLLASGSTGTYQLLSYQIQVLQAVPTPPIYLAGSFDSTPSAIDSLPYTSPKTTVNLVVSDDGKVNLVAAMAKLPPVVQEFSATDGSIQLMRKDTLEIVETPANSTNQTTTPASATSQDSITVAQGQGKVSDDAAWSSDQVKVFKLENGSIEVDRKVTLDAQNKLVTDEHMIFNLKSSVQIAPNDDSKLTIPNIDIKPAQN